VGLFVLALGCVFLFRNFEQSANWLVFLPISELAVAGAVPDLLALAAALSCRLAATGAFGVLHKLLEHLICVELHQTIHIFFSLLRIRGKEVLHLVDCDFLPVASIDDPSS